MNTMNNHSPGDALRDLWIELTLAPVPAAEASSGASVSSGSSGLGSGGGGYGLELVAPNRFSAERILRIMHDLCEKDAGRP